MSAAPAIASLQPAQPPPALALGQMVTALVLRQFDASRYLVRMLGQDRVVESMSALRANELVHARVVTLGERIELERMPDRAELGPQTQAGGPASLAWQAASGRAGDLIAELFGLYRAQLEPADAERLRRAVERAARPERMALAGLVLRKVGLPLEPELLQPLYETLGAPGGLLAPLPADEGTSTPPAWWSVAQFVLNTQSGGSLAHSLGSLPVRWRAKEIDADAALFEERDRAPSPSPSAGYRKVVLALDTERLGRVEVRATMAEQRLRVVLASERRESTNALLRHGESLAGALAAAGWQVDEIAYETRSTLTPSGPVQAALEHLIAPGSVDRLL